LTTAQITEIRVREYRICSHETTGALAEKRIADPSDRERFVALVREAMASSIIKGEPLPSVRLRERDTHPKPDKPPWERRTDALTFAFQ